MHNRNTKQGILDAFDQSEKKSISDVCQIAGITRSTFYFHFDKDMNFRRQVLEKQREHLAQKIAAV